MAGNKLTYQEGYGVLWYIGPTFDTKNGTPLGVNTLGPYCIKNDCRVNLEFVRTILYDGKIMFKCPTCGEIYTLPFKSWTDALKIIFNEYNSLSRRGDNIEVIKLKKNEKIKQRIEISKDKWISINVEVKEKGKVEDIHIFVGPKQSKDIHSHIIISGKTGEMRVDAKDLNPRELISAAKSITKIKGKNVESKMKFSK